MHLSILRRLALCTVAALLAVGVGSASAETFTWTSDLSGQDVIDSGLPADPAATGHASFTADDVANRVCGTFTWSGINSPVGFGHIHYGWKGQPENVAVTINLFGPPTSLSGFQSGVSGCAIVPGTEIDEIDRFSSYFNVVVHTVQYPGGAIRGQVGCSDLLIHYVQCTGN
ncbi:MAG: CHRD domain-containing protein [Gaiellaceae bacterium]